MRPSSIFLFRDASVRGGSSFFQTGKSSRARAPSRRASTRRRRHATVSGQRSEDSTSSASPPPLPKTTLLSIRGTLELTRRVSIARNEDGCGGSAANRSDTRAFVLWVHPQPLARRDMERPLGKRRWGPQHQYLHPPPIEIPAASFECMPAFSKVLDPISVLMMVPASERIHPTTSFRTVSFTTSVSSSAPSSSSSPLSASRPSRSQDDPTDVSLKGGTYRGVLPVADQPTVTTTANTERIPNAIDPASTIPPTRIRDPLPDSTECTGSLSCSQRWWHRSPYARLARLDKPIGTWLLFWPCAWSAAASTATSAAGTVDSVSLAAFVLGSGFPDPVLLLQFGLGSVLLRGAGCTVNDLWDADIDRKVSRTVSRPLASGELSRKEALAFLAAQLVAGWFLLVSLPHTLYCVRWGVASLPLVATYPAMKRFFRYPQLVLGLTMNWGAFMGCAAVNGTMDYHLVLPLFGSGVAWTLVYDTIYAHQDKADDAKLGLQSTALAFGSDLDRQRALLTGLATVAYLQWLHVAVLGNSSLDLARQSAFFWIASLGGMTAAYGHLLWQVRTVNFSSPESCLRRFQSNQYTGALVFASLVATKFCSV